MTYVIAMFNFLVIDDKSIYKTKFKEDQFFTKLGLFC